MPGVGQSLQALSGSAVSDPLVMVPRAPGGKVEWLPGLRGRNARYVVTNISRKTLLYEQQYCAQGAMENRIRISSCGARRPTSCGPACTSRPSPAPSCAGSVRGTACLAHRHPPLPTVQACRQAGRCAGSASVWPRPSPCRMCSPAPSSTCVPRPRRHPGSSGSIPSQTDASVSHRRRERCAWRTSRRAPEHQESGFDPVNLPGSAEKRPETRHNPAGSSLKLFLDCRSGPKSLSFHSACGLALKLLLDCR